MLDYKPKEDPILNINDYIEDLRRVKAQAERLSEAIELGVCVSMEKLEDCPEYWHLDIFEWTGDNDTKFCYDFDTLDEINRYMAAMEYGARLLKREEI